MSLLASAYAGVTNTRVCGEQTNAVTAPVSVHWMGFDLCPPIEGAEIDSDGQTIRGSKTYVDAISSARTVPEWELRPQAE
ncbi:MAG TPA: hypothetical protein VFO35_08410 [Steroidobacteraceae bacterium]|nr:hypothetical protein [Steroidobacteraceae bacterium]